MMVKKVLTFGDIEIEKQKFCRYKSFIFLEDVNIDNILVSNKFSFGKKNYKSFISYLDKNKIKPFTIILPKTSSYENVMRLNESFLGLKMKTY